MSLRIRLRKLERKLIKLREIEFPTEELASTIFIERKPPEGNFGKDGDLYIDVSSFDLIEKKDGEWL